MPSWPGGLHRAGGTGVAFGGQPRRAPVPEQEGYWRRTTTALHVGANAVTTTAFAPGGPSRPFAAPISQVAYAGPTTAGELWRVALVQVNMSGQYNTPPLVTQQQVAQANGSTSTPPPPIMAQAWLSAAGVNIHLLAQTTQGTYDTLDLGGQVITPGEAITVQWWSTTNSPFPGTGWIALRGTRSALSIV